MEKALSRQKSQVMGLLIASAVCFVIAILIPINNWLFILSFTGIPAIYSAASLKDPMEDSLIFNYYFWWWYLVKLVLAFIFGSLGFIYIVYKVLSFLKRERSYKELFNRSPNYQVSGTVFPSDMKEEDAQAANVVAGSAVYAQYSGDNWFYLANVEEVFADRVTVRFFDNIVETLPLHKLRDIDYALNNMSPHANMNNIGYYYQCGIEQIFPDHIVVNYFGNQPTEKVSLEQLRFTMM
ncbi:tudor domain-containing protein [Salisediminibacterium halotolerans]|uniref:tudor domain-containing protein n=2 Tax=Salisediminibacterium halotolerans TaxID=517425 RepID=UPI000EB3CDF2|nr:tudor domain-containing protein [Salisediminibacterium halotolerans]GEL08599.1 hypothetical protein SHA02_20150 [Salisediminibacterium halotolerans]